MPGAFHPPPPHLTRYPHTPNPPPCAQLFTGITAFLICLALPILWALGMRRPLILPELVINILWCIFW